MKYGKALYMDEDEVKEWGEMMHRFIDAMCVVAWKGLELLNEFLNRINCVRDKISIRVVMEKDEQGGFIEVLL